MTLYHGDHKEKMMQLRSFQAMILFVLVSLVGCQQNNTALPSVSSVSAIRPTETFTSVPSVTPSFTSIPTITVTASPQPTATVTLIPLPTLEKDKVRAKLDQLYTYNDGCKLPCWWGITPGVTTWSETLNFLQQFDAVGGIEEIKQVPLTENPSEYIPARWGFPSPLFDFETSADFEIQNGIVTAIRIWGDVVTRMFPGKRLYSEYGQSDRTFIIPGPCKAGKDYCHATLYLVYDKNRFMSIYSLPGTINNQMVSLCISGISDLTMWAPGVNIDLDAHKQPDDKFIPLQTQVFKMNSKSNDIERCFDVPKIYGKNNATSGA